MNELDSWFKSVTPDNQWHHYYVVDGNLFIDGTWVGTDERDTNKMNQQKLGELKGE